MYNKRILALILVLGLGLTFLGCGTTTKDKDEGDSTVVAKVNGDKVTKSEFDEVYDQVKQNYYITEEIENDPEQEDMIKELKLDVLEQLIAEKLMAQKAEDAGFVVGDEELNWGKEEFDNIISDIAYNMEAMDSQQEGEEDQEDRDYTDEAKAYIQEELDEIGKTQDEYIEILANQKVMEDYLQSQVEGVTASQEEIEEYYNERLKSQKEDITSIAYEEVQLLEPSGARVKHILISLSEEDSNEYMNILAEGDEDKAKDYLEEKLKEIKPKAKEVLEKANNEEDFENLIEEYGEDPGMEGNEEGYIVRQDGQFVPEFEEASLKLEEGEISDLVGTAHGYHIIKLYENFDEEVHSLEEKQDEIKGVMDQQKKTDAWLVMLEDWKEEAKIKRYEKRI